MNKFCLAFFPLILLVLIFDCKVYAQSERVVGIIPFHNQGSSEHNWVNQGIEEILQDKLEIIDAIAVYEPQTLHRVLKDLHIQSSQSVKAKSAFSIGKQTGIEVLFAGSYKVTSNQLNINARLISTYTGSPILERSFTGPLDKIFANLVQLIEEGMDVMQIPISSTESDRLHQHPTSSIDAFKAYCQAYIKIDSDSPMEVIAGYFQKALQMDPNFWEAQFNLGVIYYNFRLYDKAMRQFNIVLENNRDYYKPYFGRGIIYYLENEYNRSLQELKRSIELNPEHDRGYYYLGIVYSQMDSVKKSIQVLEKSIEINPNYAPAHYQLGLADMRRGWFKKAITSLNKATKLNPDYYQAINALGEAYYALNQFEEATIEFNKVIKLKPDFSTAYFNLGNSIYRQGALAEIVDAFWSLLEGQYLPTGVNNPSGSPVGELKKLREESRIEDSSTILKKMVSAYRTALNYDQGFYEASYNLALTYEKLNRPDSAEYFYKKAISRKSNLAQAHMRLGKLYEDQEKYDQALDEFKKVVEIEPDYFAGHSKLGEEFRYADVIQQVLDKHQQRLQVDPHDKNSLKIVGKIYLSLGRINQAERYFEQLVQISPNDALAQKTLRKIRRELRKL